MENFTFFNYLDMVSFLKNNQDYDNVFYVTLKDLTIVKMKFIDSDFYTIKLFEGDVLREETSNIELLSKYAYIYNVLGDSE